jgi:hypothetical protein
MTHYFVYSYKVASFVILDQLWCIQNYALLIAVSAGDETEIALKIVFPLTYDSWSVCLLLLTIVLNFLNRVKD